MGERAAAIAGHFSLDRAMAGYASLIAGTVAGRNNRERLS